MNLDCDEEKHLGLLKKKKNQDFMADIRLDFRSECRYNFFSPEIALSSVLF